MDTADKFVNNDAPKRAALLFVLLTAAALIAGWFVSGLIADAVVKEQIRSMLAVCSDEQRFIDEPSDAAVAEGEALCTKYGVSTDMDPRIMAGWKKVRLTIFAVFAVGVGTVSAVWLMFSLFSLFGIYDRMEKIRRQCILISEGAESEIPYNKETFGCIRRVYDGVDLLAKRLNHLNLGLMKEKRFLGDFLTDLSHQLKTSIAIVKLNSEIISETEGLSEEMRRQLFDEITFNTNAMESLITAALKLAKLNADAVEYRFEETDLKKTCEALIRRIKPLLRHSSIDISLECSDDSVIMNHDRVWLSEAVENVIKNSADHSECTAITVKLCKFPTNITLSVEDNGKGMTQEEIPKLFERFGKKSSSSVMTSVGIGLSIAKSITEGHNGEIIVYSELGKGTRFDFVFL